MGGISKGFLLLVVVVLAVSSLIAVEPVIAQVGVTTPSMPDFGAMYHTFSTDVPPTYGVDPNTGKAVITQPGYTRVNRYVFVEIVNQPFIPYTDSNGHAIKLYYYVRWKEHSDNSWTTFPSTTYFTQSTDSERSLIIVGFKGNNENSLTDLLDFHSGDQIDFQVEASIGYYTADNVFVGKTSGWSNTQTTTIPASSTPEIPEFPQWTIFIAAAFVTAALVATFALKRKAQSKPSA